MIEPGQIIYLDNNATTQLEPRVIAEMEPFLTKYYGNPSSGYGFGAQVRNAVEQARERVAHLLGCQPSEIVFTSGGTEANNTALNSALRVGSSRRHIVTTAVEHSAVRRTCEHLGTRGFEVTYIEVDESGALDLDEVDAAIRPDTALVSTMWANNETGVLFPIQEIGDIVRQKRILFHTDAVQAIGKLPVNLADTAINFLSLSAHKIYGPKGVGALFVNRRTAFAPMIFGGSQEENRRAGTENVAAIVGFGKAAECAAEASEEERSRTKQMRDRFEAALRETVAGVSINGEGAPRLSNTSSLSFAGIDSDAALLMLDRHNICCSAGSACRTGSLEASRVLRAMHLSEERLRGTVRFSFGRFNTEADVDESVPIIRRVVQRLRELSGEAARPVAS